MNVLLWILQSLLALLVIGAGGTKLAKDRTALLADKRMSWANDFSAAQVKLIGAAEVAGGLGLVLPRALGVAPVLTPIAAIGLAALMAGAVVVHLRRGEKPFPAAVLVVFAIVIAMGRFIGG